VPKGSTWWSSPGDARYVTDIFRRDGVGGCAIAQLSYTDAGGTPQRARPRTWALNWATFIFVRTVLTVVVCGVLLAGCSLRSTDDLQAGDGGGGALGCDDCDGDGTCEDLMTTADHCGRCGVACPSGPCVQGACVIAEDSGDGAGMMGVSSNTEELFFAGTDGGVLNLFKMPLGGGSEESLIALPGSLVGDVFINATSIYAAFEAAPPMVAKGDKDEVLNPSELKPFPGQPLSRIDGADITVCWTIVDGAQCTFDGEDQGPIDVGELTADVAVSNNVVYITASAGNVYAAPINATAPAELIGTVDGPMGIAGVDVDQGILYIAADDGIWTMPTSGGTATQLTSQAHAGPFDLVVDQGRIYVTTMNPPSLLFRASVDGGSEEVLYDGGSDALVAFVEARNEYVYFSSFYEARLYRRHIDAAPPAP